MTLSSPSSNKKQLPGSVSCDTWPASSQDREKIRSRSARKTSSETKYSRARVCCPAAVRRFMTGGFYPKGRTSHPDLIKRRDRSPTKFTAGGEGRRGAAANLLQPPLGEPPQSSAPPFTTLAHWRPEGVRRPRPGREGCPGGSPEACRDTLRRPAGPPADRCRS